jgi:asparagine synthase (glutamine-hydrolysing)
MCGIAGIVSPSVKKPALWPMIGALHHRGPDDWGDWGNGLCALGHRRLAIIDLSQQGKQPLPNEDKSVWIVFNGEVYNYHLLRIELESQGHRFRSQSDTEVIVHAYENWGTDCLQRLRGMFAFAIWDERKRRLFLARDRVGKKPLFYADLGNQFIFASELQALLANSDVPREVDLAGIDEYLSWGYIPAPRTGFRHISKLTPAHYLTLDVEPQGWKIRTERYWDLSYLPKLSVTENEAAEQLRDKLTEAVRCRLISDVPLGAFLSGGVDSSIVVGLMAQVSSSPLRTFSIGFDEADYNELGYAREVAKRWGTHHTELIVKPDALAVLPTLVRHYGEPYADSSAVPTFYLAQLTRSAVTVALTGDGGDENFAGYERYLANRLAERFACNRTGAWTAARLGKVLPDSINPRNPFRRAKRFLSVAFENMPDRYGKWVGFFTPPAKALLYNPAFARITSGSGSWMTALWDSTVELNPIDAAMAVDIKSYLPYDLLVKIDIASMANSLETRCPFLDHEVLKFAASLPANLKQRGFQTKYLLKRTFANLLPRDNLVRRKMGFGIPVAHWFRRTLRPLLEDGLLSMRSVQRQYFRSDQVRKMVDEHVHSRADHSFLLWNLLMLELWHREFVDKPPSSGFGFDLREPRINEACRSIC